jgi:pilus assembly protein Flp/PilA
MLAFFSNAAARVRRDEKGATAVEYGIMVALIAVVIIVAVTLLGGNLTSTFNSVACSVKGGTYTAACRGCHGCVTARSSTVVGRSGMHTSDCSQVKLSSFIVQE